MKQFQLHTKKQYRFGRFLLFLLFIFAFLVPLSFIVMVLWNDILVPVLHVSVIGWWQALGIFALSKILFGGLPGKPGWAGHRRRQEMEEMRNKWFNLSPEEKKHFKEDWKTRSAGAQSPVAPDPAGTE